MATPVSPSLFLSLANVWRHLSLRSDIDNIILELLGHFSLEKVYAESDKETYQHLVVSLLAQLNVILYLQRLSLPTENLQVGWYLRILASWEVILRSVEFVLQIIVDGRDYLWEVESLRNKYLAEFLLSALRVLTLHPKCPANQSAKDRRERFARVHRSLERVYDSYPGSKSFLLTICKEISESLRTNSNTFPLPLVLRYELPNLASELYPLADCLSPQSVAAVIPQDGYFEDWLSQILALRDISQFVVAASVQYVVNGEARNVHLQSTSARTRNAVFHALDHIRMPPNVSKLDLVATFSDIFRIILPDTLNIIPRDTPEPRFDETEMDALDSLCSKLKDRQLLNRASDKEILHSISAITRSIALLDDPNGQFRNSGRRGLYVVNCAECHLVGRSQLREVERVEFPSGDDTSGKAIELDLPPQSTCIHCGGDATMVREISLARQAWDLLKPLEGSAETINFERHLTTQFRLAAPKVETGVLFRPGYSDILSSNSRKASEIGPTSLDYYRSTSPGSTPHDRSHSLPHTVSYPYSPDFNPISGSPGNERPKSDYLNPLGGAAHNHSPIPPDSNSTESQASAVPGANQTPSNIPTTSSGPSPIIRNRTVSLSTAAEKGRSSWRSKLTGSRKESSADTSSLSSTTLESQRQEEISLKTLISTPKFSGRGKNAKTINVHLSQNSTHALFWTQLSIQIWDVGSSPPMFKRAISTESTCIMAAVTKSNLAYIIGTRDQKLTLRIVNLVEQSALAVEYRMASSLWCSSITICPKENYVVVGFENSTVRFFRTKKSEEPREDHLHHRYHSVCKGCPPVDTLSFANDGLVLLASTRNPKSGMIQVYSWQFPFLDFQELTSCRYQVPLHESEDNGVSSTIFRSGIQGEEDLICITTWTQSGIPVLVQPQGGHRSDIKTEISKGHGRLGSRIQCAAFSPSGRELAMVNDKGHLYQISRLNSNLMEIRKIATSKELTARSNSFTMAYMKLPDEEAIILAWVDSSKALGFIKKIPVASHGDTSISMSRSVVQASFPAELPGDSKGPAELTSTEVSVPLRTKRDSKEGLENISLERDSHYSISPRKDIL